MCTLEVGTRRRLGIQVLETRSVPAWSRIGMGGKVGILVKVEIRFLLLLLRHRRSRGGGVSRRRRSVSCLLASLGQGLDLVLMSQETRKQDELGSSVLFKPSCTLVFLLVTTTAAPSVQ